MTWGYRVARRTSFSGGEYFAVHEVYYDERGAIHRWTSVPVPVDGDTVEECRQVLDQMRAAFDRPILDFSDARPLPQETENR